MARARTVTVEGRQVKKPMLVGFAKAEELRRIAKASSFGEGDTNQEIARMLQALPVRKWQRPLDRPRIAEMAGFFSTGGHLMPNPVLLAENPDLQGVVTRVPQADRVRVEIELTTCAVRDGALWILDGQHRINALADSSQRGSPVPFVLLVDEDGNYSRSEFAD